MPTTPGVGPHGVSSVPAVTAFHLTTGLPVVPQMARRKEGQ
ncbi:MAG TPA: hypothetical protein VHH34_12075 [Pseudonocardiaceae bacterium]|nr:hypothetical protein [Pseudonocardiaceae bacterium]